MKLFLIFLCLFIISTKSQNITSNYTIFNYTESTSGTAFPHSQPLVLGVNAYDDGTTLVLIARAQDNPAQANSCSGVNLEPTLRIRVIKLDGTVIEINYRNILDPLNFCILNDTSGNQLVPITIYALYDQLFLVNYVKAANSSDPTTYQEWGQVIDWNGKNRSEIYYGPSHVNRNNSWNPQSAIQLNVNKRLGFLRLGSARNSNFKWDQWQQYSIDDSGKLSLMQSNNFSIVPIDSISSQSTIMPTIDGGYAVLSVNSSDNISNDSLLATRGGLYATFLSYNQSIQTTQVLLYQFTFPNISFNGLYCATAPKGIGYRCLIAVRANSTELDYINVDFLTSASVISVGLMPNNKISGLTGLGMQAMPFGGYILYIMANNSYDIYPFDGNDNPLDQLGPFNTNPYATNFIVDGYNPNNFNAANSILKNNNTFLLASPYSNSEKSSWSLLVIPLPTVYKDNGYGNLQITKILPLVNSTVDSSTTTLNITFNNTIIPSTGYISIYKSSDQTLRQKIQAINSDFVKLMDDNKTVNIKIIGSTFNQYNEIYYVQMDANFVKDEQLYEPLSGIDEKTVLYTSKYKAPYADSATCLAQLTVNATNRFISSSANNQSNYFEILLQEISVKIPISRNRLATDEHFQYVQSISGTNLQFSIQISSSSIQNDISVPGVISSLDSMIKYQSINTFQSGLTSDLDPTYGFKQKSNLFGQNKTAITSFTVFSIVNIVLYGISQFAKSDDELSANNSIAVNNGLRFLNGVTGGFFIISHSYFFTHFSFDDVNSKPEFSLTSKIIWAVPIFINAVVFICIKCKKGFIKNFRPEQYIFLILALYDSDTLLIINKVESIFKKEFQLTAKILAFADLIIKNVPLIILQIIYFKSIVTYSIVPLFVLVTTIFKIILGIIRSIIEIFAVRYSEERNQSTFQENKNKKDKNTQIQFEKI